MLLYYSATFVTHQHFVNQPQGHKAELCIPASELSWTNRPDSPEESRQAEGGGGAETEVITEASQILAVKRVAEPNISFHEPKR